MTDANEIDVERIRREANENPYDMKRRLALARALVQARLFDEAITVYAWLWDHVLEHRPSMYGVRTSYLIFEMRDLIALHEPARAVVLQLRARVEPPDYASVDVDSMKDWLSLNEALGGADASLAWFDGSVAERETRTDLDRTLESKIIPLLVERDRWSEAGRLYRMPMWTLQQVEEVARSTPSIELSARDCEEIETAGSNYRRREASVLVRALRAAGRDAEADEVTLEATRLDGSEEMAAALR